MFCHRGPQSRLTIIARRVSLLKYCTNKIKNLVCIICTNMVMKASAFCICALRHVFSAQVFLRTLIDRVKRIWYLSPMRAAKVQASLRIRKVSPEPSFDARSYKQWVKRNLQTEKARPLALLNGWACAVKICHDGMLEETNSLDGAQFSKLGKTFTYMQYHRYTRLCIINRIKSMERNIDDYFWMYKFAALWNWSQSRSPRPLAGLQTRIV